MERNEIYNFNPGPSYLPLKVLNAFQNAILNFENTGMGILEISHRSIEFEELLDNTKGYFRALLALSSDYEIIFTTGGATQQFSMVPLNLIGKGGVGNYLLSGIWAEKAYHEAAKFRDVHIAGSSKETKYREIPTVEGIRENAAYLHFTSNNTLYGSQFIVEPQTGEIPLVCDASSDFLHRELDITKYGLIYAGAQKNLGAAGVTIVIIRKELITEQEDSIPLLLDYNTYLKHNSLYNTPPVAQIFILHEMLMWIIQQGGLIQMERLAWERASKIYEVVDQFPEMYQGIVEQNARSLMNITFRLKDVASEQKFLAGAEQLKMYGLAGHRIIGGIRVSMYNSFPVEGAKLLANYMTEFAKLEL